MGEILDFPKKIAAKRGFSKRNYERAAITAAALAAGVAGTLLVQKTTESRPSAKLSAEVRSDLQQASQNIGEITLKAYRGTTSAQENGSTISIRTPRGSIEAYMEKVDGKLDPETTSEVQIFLNRPDIKSPLGDGGVDYIFISKGSPWIADGNLTLNPDRAQRLWIEVSENNPDATNSYTITQRAEEMAHQILDPLIEQG